MKLKLNLSLLLIIVLVQFIPAQQSIAGDNTTVQLFFTSDLYGYIKPCG